MLFMEIIAVCSGNHTNPLNILGMSILVKLYIDIGTDLIDTESFYRFRKSLITAEPN
jgi:hypothetical protein